MAVEGFLPLGKLFRGESVAITGLGLTNNPGSNGSDYRRLPRGSPTGDIKRWKRPPDKVNLHLEHQVFDWTISLGRKIDRAENSAGGDRFRPASSPEMDALGEVLGATDPLPAGAARA